jgi:hypothetical protein
MCSLQTKHSHGDTPGRRDLRSSNRLAISARSSIVARVSSCEARLQGRSGGLLCRGWLRSTLILRLKHVSLRLAAL